MLDARRAGVGWPQVAEALRVRVRTELHFTCSCGVAANKTLAATPAGWQTALKTAWAAAKPDIGTPSSPVIVSLLAAVDAAIGGL